MIVIGIDPGAPLTIAALSTDGAVVLGIWDYEHVAACKTTKVKTNKSGKSVKWNNDPARITALLRPYAALGAHVVIEAVAPMPSQGVVSSCRFVGSRYLAEGICAGLGIAPTLVTPAKWKRDMKLSSDKEISRRMALGLWPAAAARFKRKMDHDRAEAALIAKWYIQANSA